MESRFTSIIVWNRSQKVVSLRLFVMETSCHLMIVIKRVHQPLLQQTQLRTTTNAIRHDTTNQPLFLIPSE